MLKKEHRVLEVVEPAALTILQLTELAQAAV
jgi:hypothetical protein